MPSSDFQDSYVDQIEPADIGASVRRGAILVRRVMSGAGGLSGFGGIANLVFVARKRVI